jgi:hypothetical protein
LSGDNDASKIDASTANLKMPDGDNAEGEGTSLVESISRGSIGSTAPVQTDPSAANRAAPGAPSAREHKQKCSSTVPKCKQTKTPADQVMPQIELPLYRGPKSHIDLVAIKIIFGCLFEAFRRTSQAAGARSSAGGDTQPLKKKKRQC